MLVLQEVQVDSQSAARELDKDGKERDFILFDEEQTMAFGHFRGIINRWHISCTITFELCSLLFLCGR